MESADQPVESRRVYDVPPSDAYADFMKTGWAPSPLEGITQNPVIEHCFARRNKLSEAFSGLRILIPSGNAKVRSNDTDYRFRPHSAFAYYTGVQGEEVTSDAVLVMEPNRTGHDSILYIQPRSTRDTSAFYNDRTYGELWVGRRFTTDEAATRFGIEVRKVADLAALIKDGTPSVALTGVDALLDSTIKKNPRAGELENFVSVARLIKDDFEINEMQKAVDVTHRGFNDVIMALPSAITTPRGERVVEAAFFGRARIEGNDLGYDTISAAGAHACVLHWTRNDGDVKNGELLLLDAGVELDSYYTADITRTLPINGKFSPAQRSLYMLVYEAQKAGIAAIRAGVDFLEINKACHQVLAQGLVDMGVLTHIN